MIPLLIALIVILGELGIFITISVLIGRAIMRPPKPLPPDAPDNYGIAYTSVQFYSRDQTLLHGRWLPSQPPAAAKGTIIMCHGRYGGMDRDTACAVALCKAGFNVLMFNFRGHDTRPNAAFTYGMYEKEDLLGAIDFLVAQGIRRVGVLGFSMGATTALITAAISDRIGAVVADSAVARLKYTLARSFQQRGVPFPLGIQLAAWSLVTVLARTRGRIDQVDGALWVPHVRCPVLFIHGEKDRLVAPREARKLTERAGSIAQLWKVPNAAHRESFAADPSAYIARVSAWFSRWLN